MIVIKTKRELAKYLNINKSKLSRVYLKVGIPINLGTRQKPLLQITQDFIDKAKIEINRVDNGAWKKRRTYRKQETLEEYRASCRSGREYVRELERQCNTEQLPVFTKESWAM